MSHALSGVDPSLSELVLRCTPPRPTRQLLHRPRLSLTQGPLADVPVVLLQAPPGFGKSSLLAQWRQQTLEQGDAVAWLGPDSQMSPRRFAAALALAVRIGCARAGFGAAQLSGTTVFHGLREVMTSWLAEVAMTPLRIVLMIDEAANLCEEAQAALSYLLHNLPPNLRMVVASRDPLEQAVADLVGYGGCAILGADTLRFQLDETLALLRTRLGSSVDADAAARIHDCADGWPQGIHLALGALQRGVNLQELVGAVDPRHPEHALFEPLCSGLSEEDVSFLTITSACDLLHPRLCEALSGRPEAGDTLARLAQTTPLFFSVDDAGWFRCNALARGALQARFARLPVEQRSEIHRRAMEWFVREGMFEQAARHARSAGLDQRANDLAEQCFYEAVMQGRLASMLDWLDQLPAGELARRPRLRMAAAWALALGERHRQAQALVRDILEDARQDEGIRYECALIQSGAALFADDPDAYVRIMQPWTQAPPPTREARLLQMHANRLAMFDILQGQPARARRHQEHAPIGRFGPGQVYALRWSELIHALSHVWAGQLRLAEPLLQRALQTSEAELGRRHPLACMLAALLALVLYEADRLDEALAVQADRLDVLEHSGLPDTLLLGMRTAVRVAAAQGREHHALDIAQALEAAGDARGLPRLSLAGLGEQVRLHAALGRVQTCRTLLARIDQVLVRGDHPTGPLWQGAATVLVNAARAHTAIAEHRWGEAEELLAAAQQAAVAQGAGRLQVVAMALRAYVAERSGRDGSALLGEAVGLARASGLRRSLQDSHPGVASAMAGLRDDPYPAPQAVASPGPPADAPMRAAGTASVLTPKERAILELLARNLSNKEVARALGVGEATIKWHLKNLFAKLDAGSRRQVVVRARVLGFLGADD
ncbi:LuxR C-terminal-related transcriptional regulator [Thiomonas sp. FB-6]|uniref:LuxR C-terminal-related transcriptional regulator n=1 Tax=Thiomonas sp. FB-6 TaxID=1158291 RepID=UPI00037C4923|nr:LuxR C-terminal-related transcriptional regulator [Thiomonas sp. FB-6]